MLGWKLFARAVRLLLDDVGSALRVSALPYGAVLLLSLALSGESGGAGAPSGGPTLDGTALGLILLNLGASLWIAVAWHRHVLLDRDQAGWVPEFDGEAIWGYLWRSLAIGALVALTVLVVTIPLGTLGVVLIPGIGQPLVAALALFVAMVAFYRLALVLPARAVGRELDFGEALRVTSGHSATAVVLALLTVALSFALQIPVLIEGPRGVVTIVYQAVTGWIGLLVGVSTLTALYGHLVEGRPVD
jgi:hypothetical protein